MKSLVRNILPGATISVVSLAVIFSVVSLTPQVYAREATSGGGSNSGSGKSTEIKTETEHSTDVETEHGTEVETEHATETEVHKSGDDATKRTAAEAAAKAARQAQEQALKERRDAAKAKLSDAKLKMCNSRKANIDNRVSRISDRLTKHLTLFSTIAERAQAFYVAKGHTLATYDSLVADVAAKKTAAQTAVDAANAKKTTFTCEGTEPKLAIEAYKLSVTEANVALKEYRTAIKSLITGIKSVNQSTSDNTTKSTGGAE